MMNYKLSLVLLCPLLMSACTKDPSTQSTTSIKNQTMQVHSTSSQPKIIVLEVAPETKPCEGVAPQTCLLVRELTLNPAGEKIYIEKQPSYFYESIDGFTHDPQSTQIIKVKRSEILHPAADQSQFQYTLDSIIETTAKP